MMRCNIGVCLAFLWVVGSAFADPCVPQWDANWGTPGSSILVKSLGVFDDGNGNALYVGGFSAQTDTENISGLGRWDGNQWHSVLGASGSRIYNNVNAFAVFNDGSGPALYAATAVMDSDGRLVNGIAEWDGSEWTTIGISGTSGIFWALDVFDDGTGPALYAGGGFTVINGEPFNYLAKWNGDAWSAVGGGVSPGALAPVQALKVFDDGFGPALYVGGWYTHAGGVLANSIARWDGQNWSALGSGLGGYPFYCKALEVFDDGKGPALYVGGTFLSAGGDPANCIAKWDGAAWSPLGSGTSSGVLALQVFDDGSGGGPALFVGGFFGVAGGQTQPKIAKWDGAQWVSFPSALNWEVYAMEVFDDGHGETLFMGGQFTLAGGAPGDRITAYRSCINGDFDLDRDVDMSDFAMFVQCYNGSLHPPAASCPPGIDADFDGDSDVDLGDFAAFSANYTGAR